MAKGIDVENRATQGKLTGFIDVVNLTEAKLAQGFADSINIDMLVLGERQTASIQLLTRNHHLGKCFRIGYDILGTESEYLRTKNLAGGVFLTVFDSTFIA